MVGQSEFVMICGQRGVGKTSLMCAMAQFCMTGENAVSDIQNLKAFNKSLNKQLGMNLTTPKNHTVFSDLDFYAQADFCRPVKTYEIDGWRFGLPNPFWDTAFIPRYSTVCLTELQKIYDSRRTNTYPLPPFVTQCFAWSRQNFIRIIGDCQRPVTVDKSIRGLCDRFIFPVKQAHKYDKYGTLIETTWDCIEFYSTDDAEKYSDSKIICDNSKKTKYTFKGNIYACYDSFAYWRAYYNVPKNADYSFNGKNLVNSKGADFKLDYDVPKIFLKKAGEIKWFQD
jgi:energy-coupling factor transporter ATP-binding protein EcfA2